MHKFLRAIGFSDFKKKDLEIIIENIVENPEIKRVAEDSEGNRFVELAKTFGEEVIGLMIRGYYDEEDVFHQEYYYPFAEGMDITSPSEVFIEKHAEKESYAGVCDDISVGVSLIFYLQNVADYLHDYKYEHNDYLPNGCVMAALSVEGKILLPIETNRVKEADIKEKNLKRQELLAEARAGKEEAIESLTLEDMDTYSDISNRILKEDILTIVASTFMPYGIESDQYSIIAEILACKKIENTMTKEFIYYMKLNCNDLIFSVAINEKDLLGEPEVGRRFKGNIWLQGSVCLM